MSWWNPIDQISGAANTAWGAATNPVGTATDMWNSAIPGAAGGGGGGGRNPQRNYGQGQNWASINQWNNRGQGGATSVSPDYNPNGGSPFSQFVRNRGPQPLGGGGGGTGWGEAMQNMLNRSRFNSYMSALQRSMGQTMAPPRLPRAAPAPSIPILGHRHPAPAPAPAPVAQASVAPAMAYPTFSAQYWGGDRAPSW